MISPRLANDLIRHDVFLASLKLGSDLSMRRWWVGILRYTRFYRVASHCRDFRDCAIYMRYLGLLCRYQSSPTWHVVYRWFP